MKTSEQGPSFEDLTLDDVSPASAEGETPSEPEEVAAPPSADPEAAAPTPDTPEAPVAPADAVPAPPEPEAPKPEPFTLTVDGRPVPLDGIVKSPDGMIQIPESLWNTEVAPKFLANREAWTAKERGYTRAIQERDAAIQAKTAEVAKASEDSRVAHQFLDGLIQQAQADPAAFVGSLDQIIAQLPLRVAQARLAMREQEEQARARYEQEARQQQEQAAADVQLSNFLNSQVEQAIAGPYKALAETTEEKVELIKELETLYGGTLFAAVPPEHAGQLAADGWQLLGVAAGRMVGWHPQRFTELLDRRLARVRQIESRGKTVSKVEQRNAAALKPTAPPKPPAKPATPARNEAGQFTTQDKRRQAIKSLQDMTMEDLMA